MRTSIGALAAFIGIVLTAQGCGRIDDGDAGPASGGMASGGAASGDTCTGLAETDCASRSDCAAYRGYPVDEINDCVYDATTLFLGCYPGPVACDASIEVAQDETGQEWQFPSSCIPPTFVREGVSPFPGCPPEPPGGLGGAGGAIDLPCYCSPR